MDRGMYLATNPYAGENIHGIYAASACRHFREIADALEQGETFRDSEARAMAERAIEQADRLKALLSQMEGA